MQFPHEGRLWSHFTRRLTHSWHPVLRGTPTILDYLADLVPMKISGEARSLRKMVFDARWYCRTFKQGLRLISLRVLLSFGEDGIRSDESF